MPEISWGKIDELKHSHLRNLVYLDKIISKQRNYVSAHDVFINLSVLLGSLRDVQDLITKIIEEVDDGDLDN